MRDYGFMQQRTVEDFDGHTWEVFYMDLSKVPAHQPREQRLMMSGHVQMYGARSMSF
jgi:hypothetical protein